MATGARGEWATQSDVASVSIVDDSGRPPRASRWLRVALTACGSLAVVAATAFVVKTGVAATTATESDGAPPTRTVVAVPGPQNANPPATAVTVTVPSRPAPPQPSETFVSVAPNPPAGASGAQPMGDPREIVYTVAGNQRPDDHVTIVYADETGALRTAENVALPWTMTVVPSPDAPVNYVTATSLGSQLNCWITDAGGVTVASQVQNTITTTCNR